MNNKNLNNNGDILNSIKRFFQIVGFCCCILFDNDDNDTRRNGKDNEMREPMTKIRLGFNGKDTWINAEGVNFHQTFGIYSVLLDQDDQVVPLTKNGELFEPLDTSKKYKIVANRYGSSESKWKQHKQKEKDSRKSLSLFKKKQQKLKQQSTSSSSSSSSPNIIQSQAKLPSISTPPPLQQQQNDHTLIEINHLSNTTNYPIEIENVNINNNNKDKDNNNIFLIPPPPTSTTTIPTPITNSVMINNIKKDFKSDNKFYT